MSTVSFLRHNAWVAPEDFGEDVFNIIGVGATGSHIALMLAKMGVHRFRIWDADIVENHNLPNQAYDVSHIGMLKVDALADVLKRFNPQIQVTTINRFFTHEEDADIEGPVVLTVDTMSARKNIFDTFKGNVKIPVVVETRLGFDYGELYVLNPLDRKTCDVWFGSLKNDEDIPEGPCNLRICTTLVACVASIAAHALCSYYAAERKSEDWNFDFKTMFYMNPNLSVFRIATAQ
jgi:hypothetical protein